MFMSFAVGIVGLPNVGKSTLFKALTKKEVDIEPRPFTTIHPNVGVVTVPDQRLEEVSETVEPQKTTPTTIEFVDIAGLVKGAHKGEGLGNQFLAHIRKCDAILEIIRTFDIPEVENVLGEINPEKEIETINTELLMKDLETLEKAIPKLEKKRRKKKSKEKIQVLQKVKKGVAKGVLISQVDLSETEKEVVDQYQFLTAKPILYILNGKEERTCPPNTNSQCLNLDIKEQEEIAELSEEDREELELASQINQVIVNCYKLLNLITFFTVTGGKEVRAWTVTQGATAPEAAGVVHSDFQERFIRAEVIDWKKLVQIGSWTEAKEKGKVKTVGKDYVIHDGEVIEFKI